MSTERDQHRHAKEDIDMATMLNESRRLVCIPADKSGKFIKDFNQRVVSKETKASWAASARLFTKGK